MVGKSKNEVKHLFIFNLEEGNIFFIGLTKIKRKWFLSEYINYHNQSADKLQNLLHLAYSYIIQANKNYPNFTYKVDSHNFNKDRMNRQYWSGILHHQPIHNARYSEVQYPINKPRLEKEIKKIIHF